MTSLAKKLSKALGGKPAMTPKPPKPPKVEPPEEKPVRIKSESPASKGNRPPSIEYQPDGTLWMSASAFAREMGMTKITVMNRARRLDLPVQRGMDNSELYRVKALVNGVVLGDDEGKLDVDKLDPLSRKAHYQAENDRLKMFRDSGRLIVDTDVEAEMSRIAKAVNHFFETLPDVLERDCALPPQALRILENKLDAVRAEMHAEIVKGVKEDAPDIQNTPVDSVDPDAN